MLYIILIFWVEKNCIKSLPCNFLVFGKPNTYTVLKEIPTEGKMWLKEATSFPVYNTIRQEFALKFEKGPKAFCEYKNRTG